MNINYYELYYTVNRGLIEVEKIVVSYDSRQSFYP